MAVLDSSDIKDSVHEGSYSDPTPFPSSLSPPRLMIASSPFSPCRALFLGCCSIRLPLDRAASVPYWYLLLPVPPVYVPIYSSHVGFRFAPANEIAAQCCYARLYLMKSDKPRRPSSGFGKLVVVKKAWSPFNLALGGEGTVRDSCYLFDSSGEKHFSICRYWFYCCMPLYIHAQSKAYIILKRVLKNHLSCSISILHTNSADSFRRLDVDTFRHPGTSQRSVRRLSLTLFPSGRGAATIRGLPRRTKTLPRALRRRLPPRRPNRMARLQRDRPRAVMARAESAASFTARAPDALPPRARQRASRSRRR
ncbi:unnamed protein product [Musa hybrid cultivar]